MTPPRPHHLESLHGNQWREDTRDGLRKSRSPKHYLRGPICSHTQEANVLSHISGDLMIHSGGKSVTKPFVQYKVIIRRPRHGVTYHGMVKSPAHYVGLWCQANNARLHDTPNMAGEEQNHSVTLRSEVVDSTIIIFLFPKNHSRVQQQQRFWSLGYFELELEPGMLPPSPF